LDQDRFQAVREGCGVPTLEEDAELEAVVVEDFAHLGLEVDVVDTASELLTG
jgi:hypothetical protein